MSILHRIKEDDFVTKRRKQHIYKCFLVGSVEPGGISYNVGCEDCECVVIVNCTDGANINISENLPCLKKGAFLGIPCWREIK